MKITQPVVGLLLFLSCPCKFTEYSPLLGLFVDVSSCTSWIDRLDLTSVTDNK